ncbi:MAG TPA: hypothetical protein VFY03_12685 [Woeseiaceae bacterium]|nr:hypothetical protein [Woeseiaceae bacterium]
MRPALSICLLALIAAQAHAQELEEIVVTASLMESEVPGKHLRRNADNLMLRVQIVNDAREEDQREDEVHETLLAAISAAAKRDNIELSTVTDSGFVLPLTKSNYRIELEDGSRPDTSQAWFRAKSAVPASVDDGEALVIELKRFIASLDLVGRTEVFVDGDVEVSIVNPEQYRGEAIRLLGEDVRSVTSALGDDYKVIVSGIDKPVEWARAGSLSVAIYIPYEYMVVPSSISGITYLPEY